jgi:hypothetical protein
MAPLDTPPRISTCEPGFLTSNERVTIIVSSQITSMLYFNSADIGTTGPPSAILPCSDKTKKRHETMKENTRYIVRVPSPTGDSTQVVGMRGRGQGSAVAVAARWSCGGERTAAARWNSRLLEEAANKSLISLPLFRRGDYIFIIIELYQ